MWRVVGLIGMLVRQSETFSGQGVVRINNLSGRLPRNLEVDANPIYGPMRYPRESEIRITSNEGLYVVWRSEIQLFDSLAAQTSHRSLPSMLRQQCT